MKLIVFISLSVIFIGCATQSGLSGGEKDINPPEIIESKTFPKNNSTNFNAPEIEIAFDEFIRLDKPNQNIVITPALAEKPKYTVKGKKVLVELKNELDENTTYIINFGNCISDITEGNKLSGFNYVFSTGNEIDSLTLNGFVFDAFTKEPKENILVGLYLSNEDSTAINEKPYYFGQTNSNGSFKFKNLKEGKYNLVALSDVNSNLKYNPFSDGIAFLDTMISVKYDTLKQPITLSLFTELKTGNRVKEKKYYYPGRINLLLEKKSKETVINLLDNQFFDSTIFKTFTNTDSIVFWVNNIDSVTQLNLTLGIESQELDTINLKLRKPKKKRDSTLKFTTNTIENLPYYDPVNLTFRAPIKQVDSNLIKLMNEDSVLIPFKLETEREKLYLKANFNEDVDYTLSLFPNAVIDNYGRTNDTIKLLFQIRPQNQYGNLIVRYKKESVKDQHIIQLLQKGEVIEESIITGVSEMLNYKNLLPGNYQLKVIEDVNKNGIWDAGDYLNRREPELVKLFEDKIDLKAGWDLDLTWEN